MRSLSLSSAAAAVSAAAGLWLCLCLSPLVVRAQGFEPPANWLEKIEPFAIAEDVYYVGSRELGAYLFTSPDGHILVDAPMQEFAESQLENIRTLGFDPRDVRYVLATHGHFDHTAGIARILEATDAELVLAPHASMLIEAGGRGDFFFGDRFGYPVAKTARQLEDGEVLRSGRHELQAIFTPGHTRGCTSWRTTVTLEGKERSAVLVCSLSVLSGYQLVGDEESYPGIGDDFCRSVRRLEALEAEVFLSNHGSFMDLDRKREAVAKGHLDVFLDPDGYRDYLRNARARIDKVLLEQGASACSKAAAP